MLCAGDGSNIIDPNGLATHECFEFLLDLKRKDPARRLVGFGWNYDVNMILRDLSSRQLERLWNNSRILATLKNGVTYVIEWIPGKNFSVARYLDKRYARVSDVFGFFQTSFVKALEAWNIPDPSGAIARMKEQRGEFQIKDLDKILSYCVSECELLEVLCDGLEDSLTGADLRPSNWHGAGAVAAKMLRSKGVSDHHVSDDCFPAPVKNAVMHAYFGGRTEVFLQGLLKGCVNYDINSAYPFEALRLPSLVGGHWRRLRGFEPGERYAVYNVSWRVPGKFFVMPFPLRSKGAIYYPANGSGWYHGKEVKAALAMYPEFIRVEDGYAFVPATDAEPFAFIREAYATRQEAKRLGYASEKAYKLGLNAVYGKLAQGLGFRGRTPPFQSFYWAGAITSGTRARLLDLASCNLSGVVSMATDGIVFSGDPDFVESKELGGLDKTYYSEIFIAQPGIYRAFTDDGTEIRRSRGFFTREIDYDDLQRGWLRDGPHYTQWGTSTRFVGLGSALMRADLDAWRCWVSSDRRLNLYSSRKFYDPEVTKGRVMRLFPPSMPEDTKSEIYIPKTRGVDIEKDQADYVAGLEQPLENF